MVLLQLSLTGEAQLIFHWKQWPSYFVGYTTNFDEPSFGLWVPVKVAPISPASFTTELMAYL